MPATTSPSRTAREPALHSGPERLTAARVVRLRRRGLGRRGWRRRLGTRLHVSGVHPLATPTPTRTPSSATALSPAPTAAATTTPAPSPPTAALPALRPIAL